MIWRYLCTSNCLNLRYEKFSRVVLQLRSLFISFKEKLAVLVQLSSQAVDRFTTDNSSGRPVQLERQFVFQAVDRFTTDNSSGRPVHAETLFWQIIFSEFLEPIDYDLTYNHQTLLMHAMWSVWVHFNLCYQVRNWDLHKALKWKLILSLHLLASWTSYNDFFV